MCDNTKCNCNYCQTIGPGNGVPYSGKEYFSTYTTSSSIDLNENLYYTKNLVDVKVNDDTIEVISVVRSKYFYNVSDCIISRNQSNDLVYKDVYGVKDGKMVLLKCIQGKIIPPKLEETYEFPEE